MVIEVSIAGDQVPVIPLVEVDGKAAKTAFVHKGPTGAKAGTIAGAFTAIIKVVVAAHIPAVGVNV